MSDIGLRQAPRIDEEQIEACRASGDFREIAFEWYKHVGLLAVGFANVQDAGGLRALLPRNLAALRGLLMRCAKLMRANARLSSLQGGAGEATTILDRSIVESAVKIRWLCQPGTEERFDQFVADGLKTELQLRKAIEENIATNGEQVLIEQRMLRSISSTLAESGLSEDEIVATKPIPDYASMLQNLGHERLTYIVNQRIGSHFVHGTWVSLLLQYLEKDEFGVFVPRDIDLDTNINQFIAVALAVLHGMEAFAGFITTRDVDREAFQQPIEIARAGIFAIAMEAAGTDFEPTS